MTERKTYKVTVDFTQNTQSDINFAQLKQETKEKLQGVLPRSRGTAEAQLVSIVES